MKAMHIVSSISLLLALNANAAPLGRIDLPPTVNVVRQPVDGARLSSYYVEGGLGFISYDWDIGNESFRNTTVAPQVYLAHSVTDGLDLRIGLMFAWLSDSKANMAAEGETERMMDPSISLMRPSFGARMWVNRENLFPVYFDAQLNYYFASGKDVSIKSSIASVQLGAGVSYAFDQQISAVAGLVFETSFKDGKARFDSKDNDLSLQGAGLVVGIRYDY